MSGPQDTRPRNQDGSLATGVPGIKNQNPKKEKLKKSMF